jgi:hypothetical protein
MLFSAGSLFELGEVGHGPVRSLRRNDMRRIVALARDAGHDDADRLGRINFTAIGVAGYGGIIMLRIEHTDNDWMLTDGHALLDLLVDPALAFGF